MTLMKVILFGATGMVGQGVLRECLLDPGVESVLTVGRGATGQRSEKTFVFVSLYRVAYAALGRLYPVLKRLFPGSVTTTEHIGRAMIEVARHGAPNKVLESRDINAVSPAAPPA
jgi:hypothetical protein